MTIRLQRFDFGALRDFRGPLVAAILPDEIIVVPEPPPPPTFSEDELNVARLKSHTQGYAEGFEAGLARAHEQADAKREAAEATMMQLGTLLQTLHHGYQQVLQDEAAAMSQLVLAIAKKVAGEALDANIAETITAHVARCLPVILAKPRLSIELHPDAFEQTIGPIESLLQASGYEGEIQFRANPQMHPHDGVFDWGAGQANRDTALLWQEIETLLASMPVTLPPLP